MESGSRLELATWYIKGWNVW